MGLNRRIDKKLSSVDVFIDSLNLYASKDYDNYEYYYRGHSNQAYATLPSLFRETSHIDNEDKMFRELILRCPNEFGNLNSTFQKLVKMQHYGLPTRLLDITSNPLIALFFSCLSNNDKDGEVIVFKVPKTEIKYYDSDTVAVLSNLALMKRDFDITDIENLEPRIFSQKSPVDLLVYQVGQEKSGFRSMINPKDLTSTVCVKPLSDNERIVKQDGSFLLFGMGDDITKPAKLDIKKYLPTGDRKLIIHKESKSLIINQLRTLGIHGGTVFPDIGNVAESIKQQFK